MEFTFNAYRDLIKEIKAHGYVIVDYDKIISKSVILRHDIDIDLRKAAEFSDFELNDCGGVKATYMVLITSPFYNIFTKQSREYLARIINNGHSIGLHFDETQYDIKCESDIIEYIKNEIKVLENIIEGKVKVFSMHRPSKNILEANIKISGLTNSYSNEFFSDIKYLSDSRRHWRENVFESITEIKYDKLQILTHPIWYNTSNESLREVLTNQVKRLQDSVLVEMDNNIKDFGEIFNTHNL